MTTKVESKVSILIDILIIIFGKSLNLARIKTFGLFRISLYLGVTEPLARHS